MGVGHSAALLVMILVLVNTKCYRATTYDHVVEMKSSSSAWCGGSTEECLMMDDDVEQDLEMLMMESQVIIRMLDNEQSGTVTSGSGNPNSTLSCASGESYNDCINRLHCGTYGRDCQKPPPTAYSLTIFN